MLNSVIIMGRPTADPELKYTADGTPYCFARIACDRDAKGQDGKRRTDFIDVSAWKGGAEFLSKYFTKGRMVCVKGRLQSREYNDKNGSKRTATSIQAESFYFADSKRDDAPKNGNAYYADALPMPEDDDLPAEWR